MAQRLTDLRKLARGKPCQIRLPNICSRDPATTVLAHIRMAGVTGMGLKAADIFGAWACGACHDAVDGRAQTQYSRDYLRLAHLEGMVRTIAELVKMGAWPT